MRVHYTSNPPAAGAFVVSCLERRVGLTPGALPHARSGFTRSNQLQEFRVVPQRGQFPASPELADREARLDGRPQPPETARSVAEQVVQLTGLDHAAGVCGCELQRP